MPRLILIIGFSLAFLAAANGAVFRGLAPCPDNHVAGDMWYPEGCMKCDCDTEEYKCESCGSFAFNYTKSQCYEEPNAGGLYADCCLPSIVCVGDPGFDSSKLANPPAVIDPPVVIDPVLTEEGSKPKQNPPPKQDPRRPNTQNPRTQKDNNRSG